jgi:hypothetical protein
VKISPGDAADVLKAFIQEDRIEVRIFRSRVENGSYVLVVASFAISAFLIGHVGADQLRYVTLLIDIGLVAVMFILFRRIKLDLARLRRAMKARQNLLNALGEKEMQDIDPFPSVEKVPKPDIRDSDLYWVVGRPRPSSLSKCQCLLYSQQVLCLQVELTKEWMQLTGAPYSASETLYP